MVNDWHRMENLKSAWCILNASKDAVQKLASVPIFELRVFRSKNSIELLAQDGELKIRQADFKFSRELHFR